MRLGDRVDHVDVEALDLAGDRVARTEIQAVRGDPGDQPAALLDPVHRDRDIASGCGSAFRSVGLQRVLAGRLRWPGGPAWTGRLAASAGSGGVVRAGAAGGHRRSAARPRRRSASSSVLLQSLRHAPGDQQCRDDADRQPEPADRRQSVPSVLQLRADPRRCGSPGPSPRPGRTCRTCRSSSGPARRTLGAGGDLHGLVPVAPPWRRCSGCRRGSPCTPTTDPASELPAPRSCGAGRRRWRTTALYALSKASPEPRAISVRLSFERASYAAIRALDSASVAA